MLALPRGGVPVAVELARIIGAQLDVFLVRKLGVPGRPELAFGAIASGGARVLNPDVVERLGLDADLIAAVAEREGRELRRREALYRGDRKPVQPAGRHLILVDDGLATGASMRAAVAAARRSEARLVTVAVPVGAPEACTHLRKEVDELLCLIEPEDFFAVSLWYGSFEQLSDDEVRALLEQAWT